MSHLLFSKIDTVTEREYMYRYFVGSEEKITESDRDNKLSDKPVIQKEQIH